MGKSSNPALNERKALAVCESGRKLAAVRFDPDQKDAQHPQDGKAGDDRGHKRIAAVDL